MKQRLLIVDDEPGIVDMMASYFSYQYEVLTAYCGNEALQKLARQPDLILLDINMPDIDGLTLCQKIRELITCPILFLTARVTVILSWNISGKSGRSWLLVRFTVILIQFGGVVIGGTSEKYGIKENFSRPICFLCFGGSPDVRLSLYDMQFNQQQLSLRWNRNFSRRFNR